MRLWRTPLYDAHADLCQVLGFMSSLRIYVEDQDLCLALGLMSSLRIQFYICMPSLRIFCLVLGFMPSLRIYLKEFV